jgi:hypothetical protein
VHLSLDGSLASALDDVAAQAASTQGALTSTNQALPGLAVEVDGKQSRLRAGDVEGGHPLLTFSYGESGGSDTVRALKVSAPLVATQESEHVHLFLDGSLATQSALDEATAATGDVMDQLLLTKGNVNLLFAADEAIREQVDGLAAEVAGKQGKLTPGTVFGGHQMLQNDVVRAIKGVGPVKVAVDTNHVEVWLAQSELAATPAIAALQADVGTKQSQLYAGDVEGGHIFCCCKPWATASTGVPRVRRARRFRATLSEL